MTDNSRLVFPRLAPIYAKGGVVAETMLRVFAGVALAVHGWPKIQAPLNAVEMVEGLGFYPGVVFSPLLAGTEFIGGILIALGLLTRPAAFAGAFVLAVAAYFHWVVLSQGYGGAEQIIIWALVLLFFAMRGANCASIDAKLGRVV